MKNLKKLIAENLPVAFGLMTAENLQQLYDELEFWKSVAVELYTPEDAYEECLRDVERMHHEMDYDDTGEIHG